MHNLFWGRQGLLVTFWGFKKVVGRRVVQKGTNDHWINTLQCFSFNPCWFHLQNNILIYKHNNQKRNNFLGILYQDLIDRDKCIKNIICEIQCLVGKVWWFKKAVRIRVGLMVTKVPWVNPLRFFSH